jgi:hypothetical protein
MGSATKLLELLESVALPSAAPSSFEASCASRYSCCLKRAASLKQGIDDPNEYSLIWHSPCQNRHRKLLEHHMVLDSHATAIRATNAYPAFHQYGSDRLLVQID